MIGIDQYRNVYHIPGRHPRKELLQDMRATHAERMYVDTAKGARHIGYIVKGCWITLYQRWEVPA